MAYESIFKITFKDGTVQTAKGRSKYEAFKSLSAEQRDTIENVEQVFKNPHLIQRMIFRERKLSDGFDGLLEMDYMGAAEYEYGAMPKSLKLFCQRADNLLVYETNQPDMTDRNGDHAVYIALHAETITEFLVIYAQLRNEKHRLHEHISLKEWVTGKNFLGEPIRENAVNAWWDLENHIMFTFGTERATAIVNAIKATRDKKKTENEEGWF